MPTNNASWIYVPRLPNWAESELKKHFWKEELQSLLQHWQHTELAFIPEPYTRWSIKWSETPLEKFLSFQLDIWVMELFRPLGSISHICSDEWKNIKMNSNNWRWWWDFNLVICPFLAALKRFISDNFPVWCYLYFYSYWIRQLSIQAWSTDFGEFQGRYAENIH